MLVIARNLLRDSDYGMTLRVGTGALLSTVDAGTDIFVIQRYYKQSLYSKANTLLAMILFNMFVQLIIAAGQFKKHTWKVKLKELLITLFFLRPAVDAFRVSTNHKGSTDIIDSLTLMIINKVITT